MIKIILILLFSCVFITSVTKCQEIELNYKKCVVNAFKTSPSINKSYNSIEAQESSIRTSYGSLFPTLTFSSGWTRTNQVTTGQYNQSGITLNLGTQNETTNNYNLSLRSDVTLFDGFSNYDNITLSKMKKNALLLTLEKLKQDIALKILNSYINVLKNQQTVLINEANLNDSKAQLEKIKIFVEVGKKTMADIYKQDVLVAQNELALEQSKNNLAKSIAELVYDSNFPQDKTYNVNPSDFPSDISHEAMETYINKNSETEKLVANALGNRYDFKSSEYNIEVYRQSYELARTNVLFPKLTGFASYSMSSSKIQDITDSPVFTLGLTLSYSIFQGFSLDNQRQLAEINLRSAREDLQSTRNQIALDIKKSLLDLKSIYKQIEITERNLKSAAQDKFMAEESYKIGISTLLDVQTAVTKYNNALLEKNNLVYNFILAQKQLEYYQGILKY